MSGLQYRGYWYVDKPHGFGYLIYPDGSVLKGHFAGGLQQGGFEYLSADGNVELRDYHSGNLIASRRIQEENSKTFTITFRLGFIYILLFINGFFYAI